MAAGTTDCGCCFLVWFFFGSLATSFFHLNLKVESVVYAYLGIINLAFIIFNRICWIFIFCTGTNFSLDCDSFSSLFLNNCELEIRLLYWRAICKFILKCFKKYEFFIVCRSNVFIMKLGRSFRNRKCVKIFAIQITSFNFLKTSSRFLNA